MNDDVTTSPALDWQRMPLDGRVLIEASAGTGKTYTIALIYLRLLLEHELRVEQIAVATFTEAAAQELRERLRTRLVDAERLLVGIAAGQAAPTADPLGAWLAGLCVQQGGRETALRRVRLARADIDRAPVATIHALCARIQRDYPLESGVGFSDDHLIDETALLRECLEDFWRRRYLVGTVDPLEARKVVPSGPEHLLPELKQLLARKAKPVDADGLKELEQRIAKLGTTGNIGALRSLAEPSLHKRSNGAARTRLLAIAEAFESGSGAADVLMEKVDGNFEPAKLDALQPDDASLRLRDHRLIVELRELRTLLRHRAQMVRGSVLTAAFKFCEKEIRRRAELRHAQTYAMQVDNVHQRMLEDHGVLAERLFAAFPAALIDEFQDTDAHQFKIFERIYQDSSGTPRGLLAMIGDPKQAIFAFRGGDIATYQRASAGVDQRFSLEVNYRSASALIVAMNGLYGNTNGGFDDPAIHYREVSPAPKADDKPYLVSGEAVATPLRLHCFRRDPETTALGELENQALQDCAQRIVELLNDARHTIDGGPVGPGDITVLLNTNTQIAKLRKLLVARRIPCTGSGRSSVFDTDIAQDLELVLHALINADDDTTVRAALATRLLGARLSTLCEWRDDENAFEVELERFAAWHDLAQRRGILAVIEAILETRASALLATARGERDLTDLRHLGELLSEQERSRHGLEGLYAWFVATRRDDGEADTDAADARQLRIESDGARVQLLTVHMSKGLQFPIVFLPLAWRIASRDRRHIPKALYFHDSDGTPRVDLGSKDFDENLARHFREDLQERLRVLYVALTRAVHAVHVYWVDRHAESDDLQRLWNVAGIDMLIGEAQDNLDLEPGEASLEALAKKIGGTAVIGPVASDHGEYRIVDSADGSRVARTPLPTLRVFEWLHSFSALTRHTGPDDAQPAAADEAELADASFSEELTVIGEDPEQPDDPHLLALDAWRGRRFGDAVHKVLELAEPGPVWPRQRKLIVEQLALQAVRGAEESVGDVFEPVGDMIERTQSSDLGDGLRLCELDKNLRVAEFGFQFPLHTGYALLQGVCGKHGFGEVLPASLAATQWRGMLTGYVDLIFLHQGRYHVLDYKTNRLGVTQNDYRGASLESAMARHRYDLQALLYTVALHRYLRQRLPDYQAGKHLGDSWYLFLRAVGLGPGLGVWRRRWPAAMIEQLDDAFAGSLEAAA